MRSHANCVKFSLRACWEFSDHRLKGQQTLIFPLIITNNIVGDKTITIIHKILMHYMIYVGFNIFLTYNESLQPSL